MQSTPVHRAIRWLAAVCVVIAVAGCGENPLESVGERSNEWIGPVADGVSLLSNGSSSGTDGDDAVEGTVSVSEGDG